MKLCRKSVLLIVVVVALFPFSALGQSNQTSQNQSSIEQSLIPPLVVGVVSVGLSVFGAWLLDRRKERRSSKKYDADRKAVIDFLRKLPSFQHEQQKVSEFFDKLGSYRSRRIAVALKRMNLCSFVQMHGGAIANLTYVFSNSSESDMRQMIADVQEGIYDDTFENSQSS
jgi:hypothetical protein